MAGSSAHFHNGHIKPSPRIQQIRRSYANEFDNSDESDDSYSSSEFTDTDDSNDFEPLWQEEALKAGELFYVEDSIDSDGKRENTVEANKIEAMSPRSSENRSIYKNAMPHTSKESSQLSVSSTLKTVYLNVDPATPRNQTYSAELLACMLGIVMLDMRVDNESSYKGPKNEKVTVDVLVPGGVSLRSGQIELGDILIAIDDICITTDNIESVLQEIRKPSTLKLTLQTVAEMPFPSRLSKLIAPIKTKFYMPVEDLPSVVTLLTPHPNRQKNIRSLKGPNGVFFLTQNLHSETAAENDDLLYSYPSVQPTIAPSKLSQIRGVFITIADVMQETFSSRILSTTIMIDDETVHCAYHQDDTEVLIFCVPAKDYSLPQVHLTISSVVRLLNVMYGSLKTAFQPENKQRLDHMFQFVLVLNASTLAMAENSATNNFYKLPGVRKLTLSDAVQEHVDSTLAELEASDFDDGLQVPNYTRRLYTVRGSCVFYDGYLLANHLPFEDLYDVSLFCYNHNFLGMKKKERIGLLIIWREIFRWSSRLPKKKDDYVETGGRYFLQIVGLKRSLLCTVLQLNGKLFPSTHTPRPDAKYVNHAKAALINLESNTFCEYIQHRLSYPSPLQLAPADTFLMQKTSSLFKSSKPPLGQRTSNKQSKGFKLPFNSPLKFKGATSDSDDGRKASPGRSGSGETTKTSRGLFRDRSFSSHGSVDSIGSPRQPTKVTQSQSVDEIRQSLSALDIDSNIRIGPITKGPENSLFCYLNFDPLSGILVMPTDHDLAAAGSEAHQEIVTNFKKYTLLLHQRFGDKSDNGDCCVEEAVLFQFRSRKLHPDSKKKPLFLQYWVMGRALKNPYPKEVYVCFHNTAPQSIIELAFKCTSYV